MSDDSYPRNPALAALVARARAVPTPSVTVRAGDVEEQVRAGRQGVRWPLIAGLAAAAAVLLAVAVRSPEDTGRETPQSSPVASASTNERAPDAAVVPGPSVDEAFPTAPPNPAVQPLPPDPKPAPVRVAAGLAEGVRLETVEGPEAVVVSPWRVEVAGGVYKIIVEPEVTSTVLVRHAERTLQVEPGTTAWLRNGELDVDAGKAQWLDESTEGAPSASALATTAERAMARGDRSAAIRALTTLARKHPRAAETRTGLVDLARLRAAAGDPDRARCAYNVALRRWPNAAIATDIQRALQRLGDGPECRGLTPR